MIHFRCFWSILVFTASIGIHCMEKRSWEIQLNIYIFVVTFLSQKFKFAEHSHPEAIQDVDEFVSSSDLEKCSIKLLSHQCILCREWVPSEWESKLLIMTSERQIPLRHAWDMRQVFNYLEYTKAMSKHTPPQTGDSFIGQNLHSNQKSSSSPTKSNNNIHHWQQSCRWCASNKGSIANELTTDL